MSLSKREVDRQILEHKGCCGGCWDGCYYYDENIREKYKGTVPCSLVPALYKWKYKEELSDDAENSLSNDDLYDYILNLLNLKKIKKLQKILNPCNHH